MHMHSSVCMSAQSIIQMILYPLKFGNAFMIYANEYNYTGEILRIP